MADVDKKINDYVQVLRNRATARDVRMNRIRAVRGENMDLLFPSAFSEDWPKPIVANFIRTAARDVAESIAPLPAVNCSSGAMKTERDKQRAGTKNKIGHYYLEHSRLAVQMLRAADWYGSYGFMPIYVEPDYDEQCPYMALEDPFGFYYEKNRRGRVVAAAKVWLDYASRLAAMFPEARNQIMGETNKRGASDSTLEVIRFSDNEQTVLYVPQRGMVLAQTENLTSR